MKLRKLFILMLLTLLGVTACCPFDDEENDRLIIDPDDVPMFEFGEDGIPYRWHSPMLSAAMQRDLQKEFVGYGWRWMQTNELWADGRVCPKEYYEGMMGLSPHSYYVESGEKLVTFYFSDAENAYVYRNNGYQIDVETGLMTTGSLSSIGYPWSIRMRVWSIYKLSGKWYMSCLEPVATTYTDSKEPKVVWCTSQYVRMTDDELRQMKEKHQLAVGN